MTRFSQHCSICRRIALWSILPIFMFSATTPLRGETIRRDLVKTAVAAGDFKTLVSAEFGKVLHSAKSGHERVNFPFNFNAFAQALNPTTGNRTESERSAQD